MTDVMDASQRNGPFLYEPMKYPCQEGAKNESFPLFCLSSR
jgi:hypothetical protein